MTYSVPSRLMGRRLRIHLHHDRLVGYLDGCEVLRYARVYAKGGRGHAIDYRHLIDSLSAKPQAFRGAQLRDHILPSDTYRQLWQAIDAQLPPAQACRWIVTVLRIAAVHQDETTLGNTLLAQVQAGQAPSREQLLGRYLPHTEPPVQTVRQHPLAGYDRYLGAQREQAA